MDILLEDCLDVFYSPIFMKKNRPAYKLSLICEVGKEKKIINNIFKHSTSIGIRKYPVEREVLARHNETVDTSLGKVEVKFVSFEGKEIARPEYESLKTIALEKGLSLEEAYKIIISELK